MSGKATVDSLFAAAETRLSCYNLTNETTISDDRVNEIVRQAVKHAPSSFNVQSARAVVLVKKDHEKFWQLAEDTVKTTINEQKQSFLLKMIGGFKGAYGSVLWYEDKERLDGLAAKNPMFGHLVPAWGDTSSGMHQFLVWTALEMEGLGCNLQHFNFMDELSQEALKQWDLPASWELKSQLVFGKPRDGLKRGKERTYDSLDERVKVFGA